MKPYPVAPLRLTGGTLLIVVAGGEAKPGCAIAADGWHTSPSVVFPRSAPAWALAVSGASLDPRKGTLATYSLFYVETAFGPLCLVLLGIRSPGASALVTEDLQHDIGETRIPSSFLGDGHSAW